MRARRSRILLGCSGLLAGTVLGLLLGAVAGMLHLTAYWRSGREAAGTEVALVYVYAVPGTILGGIAGLAGGLLLGRKR